MPALPTVDPEDLLPRRDSSWDDAAVRELLRDRVVLVTGAAGSIGSALCRQILGYAPARLVGLDLAETPLHDLITGLQEARPGAPFVAELADVTDAPRVQAIAVAHRPDIVFHAAALKHVPLLEAYPREAVRVNVQGTRLVAEAVARAGAAIFVLVSTDKAVDPRSVMGATKRLAEDVVERTNARGGTRYTSVRFGNVLGSRGSVLETFLRQLGQGGPLTVTHPDMTRYFMTTREAVGLVLEAAVVGTGGDVLVLDMGEPVPILDLARDLLRRAGRPEIAIEISGVRPGEKLSEERHGAGETLEATSHPLIHRVCRTAGFASEPLCDLLLSSCPASAREEVQGWLQAAGQAVSEPSVSSCSGNP